MHRSLLVAGVLCCLPACVAGPGTSIILPPNVTGQWSGTFESSWGALPVIATLTNQRGTQTISGELRIGGERASGTIYGFLEQKGDWVFYGTLKISYVTASGATCLGESSFATTSGGATERAVGFSTEGFPNGNCPDAPTKVRISLGR